jgi:hypothetical protein
VWAHEYEVVVTGGGKLCLMHFQCVAPPHQARNNGCTPAYVAADLGHDQTLRVLAEFRADLNQVTHEVISIDGWLNATTRLGRCFM